MSTPTPGWYDDGSGRQRWWDGAQWHGFAEDQHASTPITPKRAKSKWVLGAAIVASLVVISGAAVGGIFLFKGENADALARAALGALEEAHTCQEVREATGGALRDHFRDGHQCDTWSEASSQEDFSYTITELEWTEEGEDAVLTTTESGTESDGEAWCGRAKYRVQRLAGQWVVTDNNWKQCGSDSFSGWYDKSFSDLDK